MDLERAIQAIEHGLLSLSRGPEGPGPKRDLLGRMAEYKIPGFSAALIDQEQLVWTGAYGVVEAGSAQPITPDTIFQAASISKPVTGMVALHLVESGLLDLDAEVNDFLRSWQVPQSRFTQPRRDGIVPRITLRGLLSHTAGMNIRGYTGYVAGSQFPTLPQILDGLPPANSQPVRVVQVPGKSFRYSGGGYMVVQQMIEDVTGRSLAALAKEIIFEKLGMTSSTFDSVLPAALLPRAATAHNAKGKPVPGRWHTYPEQAPASLWSTPSDLARLLIEVFKSYKGVSSLVLSPEMTRQMLVPQIGMGGLGFNVIIQDGMTRFGHPGWNVGVHGLALACLETGQGLVWMTNAENGRRLNWEVARGLSEVVKWSWW